MNRWLAGLACVLVLAAACIDIDALRRSAIGRGAESGAPSAGSGAPSAGSGGCEGAAGCSSCANTCARPGAKECLGNTSRTCVADAQGCLSLGAPVDCADSVPCTVDACDPPSGECTHVPDDGMCSAPDGDGCTRASCDAEEGCGTVDVIGTCNDGDACTVDDSCSEGRCHGQFDADNPACVDECPDDDDKMRPGTCGCGKPDVTGDSDGDGMQDCVDACPDENCRAEDQVECRDGDIGTCARDGDGCLSRPTQVCGGGYCYGPTECGDQTLLRDWNVRLAGTYSVSVAINAAGEAFVAGLTTMGIDGNSFIGGESDMFLSKWSADGTRLWTKQFGTPEIDRARHVLVDNADNVIVVGQTTGSLYGTNAGHWDAVISMWNGTGVTAPANPVWQVQFGTTTWDWINSAGLTSGGDLYVLGDTAGAFPGNVNEGSNDAFLARFSRNATTPDWIRQWGTPKAEVTDSVAVALDDDVFTTHTLGEPDGSELRRYSRGGLLLWMSFFPTLLLPVAVGPDGNPIVGNVMGTSGVAKVYDTTGVPIWRADGAPFSTAATVDSEGNALFAGNVLARYSSDGKQLWSESVPIGDSNLVFTGVAAHPDLVIAVGNDNIDGNPYYVRFRPQK